MANQFSISFETIDLDLLMRRIAWVCDKHRVASGLPADLTDFLAALGHDKLLAMDFWAVVGGKDIGLPRASKDDLSMRIQSANMQREEIQEQLLEAIVRVLTGVGVSEMISGSDQNRQAIEDLKCLMGGRDIHSIATDGRESLIGSAWPDMLSTHRDAADLRDGEQEKEEQKKRVAVADQVVPSYDQDDNDIRRVLFGEESLTSGETTAPSGSGVMKLVKRAALWIEPSQLVRVVASVLLIVAVSAMMLRLHNTGLLRSYAGSLNEMLNRLGTAEDVPNGNASAAKGAAQTMKARGISGKHPQKAHPAKPQGSSVDVAAEPKSPETEKTEGDSNTVAEKLPAAYETAPGGSTGTNAGPANAGPIEVSPEVMKANLITLAGPGSSFAAGLQQGKSRVVMQVVISRLGVVESLRVTEGDAALRVAATRAVSAWRYRPYLVNGAPVAVKTTVTVNFMMDS